MEYGNTNNNNIIKNIVEHNFHYEYTKYVLNTIRDNIKVNPTHVGRYVEILLFVYRRLHNAQRYSPMALSSIMKKEKHEVNELYDNVHKILKCIDPYSETSLLWEYSGTMLDISMQALQYQLFNYYLKVVTEDPDVNVNVERIMLRTQIVYTALNMESPRYITLILQKMIECKLIFCTCSNEANIRVHSTCVFASVCISKHLQSITCLLMDLTLCERSRKEHVALKVIEASTREDLGNARYTERILRWFGLKDGSISSINKAIQQRLQQTNMAKSTYSMDRERVRRKTQMENIVTYISSYGDLYVCDINPDKMMTFTKMYETFHLYNTRGSITNVLRLLRYIFSHFLRFQNLKGVTIYYVLFIRYMYGKGDINEVMRSSESLDIFRGIGCYLRKRNNGLKRLIDTLYGYVLHEMNSEVDIVDSVMKIFTQYVTTINDEGILFEDVMLSNITETLNHLYEVCRLRANGAKQMKSTLYVNAYDYAFKVYNISRCLRDLTHSHRTFCITRRCLEVEQMIKTFYSKDDRIPSCIKTFATVETSTTQHRKRKCDFQNTAEVRNYNDVSKLNDITQITDNAQPPITVGNVNDNSDVNVEYEELEVIDSFINEEINIDSVSLDLPVIRNEEVDMSLIQSILDEDLNSDETLPESQELFAGIGLDEPLENILKKYSLE